MNPNTQKSEDHEFKAMLGKLQDPISAQNNRKICYNSVMEYLPSMCNEGPGSILSTKKNIESLRKRRHANIHPKKTEVAMTVLF